MGGYEYVNQPYGLNSLEYKGPTPVEVGVNSSIITKKSATEPEEPYKVWTLWRALMAGRTLRSKEGHTVSFERRGVPIITNKNGESFPLLDHLNFACMEWKINF